MTTIKAIRAVFRARCEVCKTSCVRPCYFWTGKTKRNFCSRRCYYLRGPKQKPATTILTFTDTDTLNLSESGRYDK